MIKMKVNNDRDSRCDECTCQWKNTAEMYTVLIAGIKKNLCYSCFDDLFHKTLMMQCKHDARPKNQIDIKRANNMRKLRGY